MEHTATSRTVVAVPATDANAADPVPSRVPATGSLPGFHAIVPAGGAGTRLWPLSRAGRPKFLLDLTGGGRTLVQQTWDRLAPLAGEGGMLVVTGTSHAPAVAAQLPDLRAANLLAEPSPRDSAAAICLAAAVVHQRDADAVVGSFAADHVIRDVGAFHAGVAEAVATARQGYIVTIGIRPVRPSTAFGYIRPGQALSVPEAASAHLVERFVEKPDAATAATYLEDGGYRWNAGMFVSRADVLLEALATHRPALHGSIMRIARAWDTDERHEVLEEVWPDLEKIAIDYAIAEPAADAGKVAVICADFGWDDVGDFASLAALIGGDGPLRVLGDGSDVLAWETGGLAVPGSGRVVAVLGLKDVVVVDTPDVLLVTTRDKAQEVKEIVDHLRSTGRADLV